MKFIITLELAGPDSVNLSCSQSNVEQEQTFSMRTRNESGTIVPIPSQWTIKLI